MGLFKRFTTGKQPLGSALTDTLLDSGVSHLENGEYSEAEADFQSILKKDPGCGSFAELDAKIRQLARNKGTLNLAMTSRKALLGLGILQAMQHHFKDAEDYILDAAYSAKDAGLFLIAGKYYLAIPDAELSTAFGYFEMAVNLQSGVLEKCDELFQTFIKGRGVYYPVASLKPYQNLWTTTSERLSKTAKGNRTGVDIDDFTTRILQALETLDIVGQNQLKRNF
jgi:hypothetical protein